MSKTSILTCNTTNALLQWYQYVIKLDSERHCQGMLSNPIDVYFSKFSCKDSSSRFLGRYLNW